MIEPRSAVDTAHTVTLSMPLSFVVFCARRRELYLRYALVRVGSSARARRLVETVIGDLAMSWPDILGGPSPAAASWQVLTARAAEAAGGSRTYDVLGSRQADAVVLRYRLGLPVGIAAELMGIGEPDLNWTLQGVFQEFNPPIALPSGI